MRVFRHGAFAVSLLATGLCAAGPARADVISSTEAGFVVRNTAEVTATPAETWAVLVHPAGWWQGQHTFSGEAANLSLDPVPGGCFCERLPAPKDAAKGQPAGGVQHMRVVYAEPGKALRLTGALGPLQSEAVLGTLTITIKPVEGGTRVLWEYVVGGFMRYKVGDIAPAVDRVLLAQLSGLAKKLGPMSPELAPPPAPAETAPPPADQPAATPAPGLSPSGKVWSLPPAAPASPTVAKPVSPRPIPAKPAAAAAKVAAKPAAKSAAKSPPAKAPAPADKDHRDGVAAFDQALGAGNP
ncbi:MAG: hypothetical protein RIS94_3518 [Pseudomonadota bacterium]